MVMIMKKVKIFNNFNILTNFEYDDIKENLDEFDKVSVVCFENRYSSQKNYVKLLNEPWVNNVILIGTKPESCFGKKLISAKKLHKKLFVGSDRIIFIIDTDVDEDVLIPLVQLFDIAEKSGIEVGFYDIVGFSNKMTIELKKALEALVQNDLYKKYEIIYDFICEELDKKFSDNSICQFENNRCIANRKYNDKSKIMGCCYSFNYNGIRFSDIKLCEHQKDKKCEVKCLGCKLFTCDYLKNHGIKFSLENMPLALAFFPKKQRELLRTTFFTSKENVLARVIAGK